MEKKMMDILDKEKIIWYGTNIIHRSWSILEIKKWKDV